MPRAESCRPESGAENEIHRAHQAQRRPHVVELERLVHVEHRERHEHGQRDRFLHDLQLGQAVLGGADAVGRHLQQYTQVN